MSKSKTMTKKNSLSIYLIKDGITELSDIFEDISSIKKISFDDVEDEVYYHPTYVRTPDWVKDFFLSENKELKQASSQVALVKRLKIEDETRIFVLLFGYSRHLLKIDSIVNRFGLKVVLNSIGTNEIRKISKTAIGTNNKRSDEQLPRESDIREFGFDVVRDLIKGVSAKTTDDLFGKCIISGNDSLNVVINRNINNIDSFLVDVYKKYKNEAYLENFKWVDNINEIKSKSLRDKLNEELIRKINSKDFEDIWMAVPEVIDWDSIKCFKISNNKQEQFDINIDTVVNSLRDELTNISQLKNKSIKAISSKTGEEAFSWSAYRCLVGQVIFNGDIYCISDGDWFLVNKNYVDEINEEYNRIELLDIPFIDYHKDDLEDGYNLKLKNSLQDSIETHKLAISVPGNKGDSIEPCDILYKNMFIHVKRNSGSQSLGHLFNQGYIAAKMLLLDKKTYNQYKTKIDDRAKSQGVDYVAPEEMDSRNYCIVFAIINKFDFERPKIPFFSKVALSNISKEIWGYGYKLKLKNIKIIN